MYDVRVLQEGSEASLWDIASTLARSLVKDSSERSTPRLGADKECPDWRPRAYGRLTEMIRFGIAPTRMRVTSFLDPTSTTETVSEPALET